MAGAADTSQEAHTIVYIHGIGNKPIASVLKCQWDTALLGFDLGERSRLAYWVSREYYPEPSQEECRAGDVSPMVDRRQSGVHIATRLARDPTGETIDDIARSAEAKVSLAKIAASIEGSERLSKVSMPGDKTATGDKSAKLLWLPELARTWITRQLTKAFLKDVNDYFFVRGRRVEMRESLMARLRVGGGPFVVIAHSQGSMIAYDVLSRLSLDECDVRLFVTIGSPLGITEVQDQMKRLTKQESLAVPQCVTRWINAADPRDPVALDARIRSEFDASPRGVKVEDVQVLNPDAPEHPHSGSGYLRTEDVRAAVMDAVDLAVFQPVAPFVIARDASRQMESSVSDKQHELLIELALDDADDPQTLADLRKEVADAVGKCLLSGSAEERQLSQLRRYVAVSLTREETERLASNLRTLGGIRVVRHVWRDAEKFALLNESAKTLQVTPAHRSYDATGAGITWAVLDSGVNGAHPHFDGKRILEQWDCTQPGGIRSVEPGANSDDNGHGSHVCGIITGRGEFPSRDDKKPVVPLIGMAPDSKVISYKVLARDGTGKDSWIIRALDHIAETVENAGCTRPIIQGVNLSLGGPFDQSSFGCGYTPLCNELRRLWQLGVVVVLAAGNEGYVRLVSDEGEIEANMALSIGDPANLEEAIAVGSVHKSKPHTYGVSYFSSKGPTADGRQKPDVVAPGERIVSCRNRPLGKAQTMEDLYLEMSGTSMATPHVSGLLAAYLSYKQEFIGRPNEVKRILLDNCVTLGRARALQGRGMPNLVRMLLDKGPTE
ncbi:MAG TPA: S8 family peptidase [Steroidobacteraceae bacterium]|nr:S8 family peptidase [Steroidobacteraceae bacterium]